MRIYYQYQPVDKYHDAEYMAITIMHPWGCVRIALNKTARQDLGAWIST